MRRFCFWLGVAMIAYDGIGHLLRILARIAALPSHLWNAYSKCIFPSFVSELQYDIFWSSYFGVAIFLLVLSGWRRI